MSKWVILGGGSTFALHLAAHILEATGDTVTAVGRNPYPAAPFASPDPAHYFMRFSWRRLHIVRDFEALKDFLQHERPDYIVNFAALAYATSWDQAEWYYATNTVAVARLAGWLQHESWLKRFIQIGTSELYGSCAKAADEQAPLNPTSPYAVSKMAADLHLAMMHKGRNFPMNIIRPSNCYAPGQKLYRILPRAAWCAVNRRKLPLEGGGLAEKSYLHVSDLARAITIVASKGVSGEIYNCGPAQPISISQLVAMVAAAAGIELKDLIEYAPPRSGEDSRYWLSSAKIETLGWVPRISLPHGVAEMVEWARRFQNQLPEPLPFVLQE